MTTVPQSVSDLIANSGNNFHAKVARWLSENGWHITVSPYYMDQNQSKARELDLVAEKLWPTTGRYSQPQGDILVRLYIECKFVPKDNTTVFWFSPKNDKAAMKLVCGLSPFRTRENNTNTKKHHYLATSKKVAKLFASIKANAQENELFFKAISQSLNALVAMRGQPPLHPDIDDKRHGKPSNSKYGF